MAVFVVTNTNDAGAGSLRDAISQANGSAGADVIDFGPSVTGTITLGGTALIVTDGVTINGPGAARLAVSGNGLSRVFAFNSGTSTLSGLTITGGSATLGGGIYNQSTLTITSSTIAGNTATTGGGIGGGIFNQFGSSLTVTNSTLSGNSAGASGGAIYNSEATLTITGATISGNSTSVLGGGGGGIFNSEGTVTVTNSTISENSTASQGGGILNYVNGALTVTNTTISANSAATGAGGVLNLNSTLTVTNTTISGNYAATGVGGIDNNGGTLTARSTIIAGNSGGDVQGTFAAGSTNNLIQDAAGAGGLIHSVDGNLVGVDPLLDPLADYGGPTRTHALLAGSPAIGAGINPLSLSTDQRGGPFVRGTAVDIGAYQRQTVNLLVDTLVDENDGDYSSGDLSLREAVIATNANPGADAITFSAALNGGTITLGGTQLSVTGDVSITGPGANLLTVSGNNASRVFSFSSGSFSLSGLTITGGYGFGGGIFSTQSTLTITNSTISGNASATDAGGIYSAQSTLTITGSTFSQNSTGAAGVGGAMYIEGGTLSLAYSTISGNSAGHGGGVYVEENEPTLATITSTTISQNTAGGSGLGGGIRTTGGTVTVINSTISGNNAATGGGIHSAGTLTLTNTTISGNIAPTGGGGIFNAGTTTARSTIVAGNTGGDVSGAFAGGSTNNLIQNAATPGGLTNGVNGNLVGVNPLLGALADNGGPTRTHALLAGSPAIGAGINALSLATDQRGAGFVRVRGSGIDIGAFEFSALPTLGTLSPSASSVPRGQSLTLTADSAADADGAIARVDFYRDANSNGIVDVGEFLGSDSDSAGGYTFVFNSAGAALGSLTFLAVAVDSDDGRSATRSASVTITNALPTIASLAPSVATLENGDPLTLTASTVADADGTVASVSFYADTNQNGVADAGELLGTDSDSSGGYTYTLTPAQTLALPSAAVTFLAVAVDNEGAKSAPRSGAATLALSAGDQFIQTYLAAPKSAVGLVDGDWIANTLKSSVANVATSDAYWGARNQWFQDKKGDVWSLWQGGSVHESKTLPGEHEWVLTNLTDAAGLSGNMRFAPGSLSGVTTGWNAFNIQGIQDGKLVALWWSPAGSAGTYVDTDGSTKQGGAWGLRGNGWSLSSISEASTAIGGAITTPAVLFRPYSQSQSNGRTEFDPRSSFVTANTGMSVIVVDKNNRVYAITFSVSQRAIPGANTSLNATWVIEPLSEVPSLADLGLTAQVPDFEAAYVTAATT